MCQNSGQQDKSQTLYGRAFWRASGFLLKESGSAGEDHPPLPPFSFLCPVEMMPGVPGAIL